jgi:superfamily II DNA or RNA helicase
MSEPTPSLRPYQAEIVDRIKSAMAAGRRRVLIVMPTGSGKTVVIAEIIAHAAAARQRTLFLAHRRELIQQASRKLHAAGVDHGVLLPGFPARPAERVQVASIATLHARAIRSCAVELPPADLVVIDEAHHARARTYVRILEAYPAAKLIGLTATPCRGDGRGLGNAFDVMVESPGVAELIAGGYLVPARVYAPTRPDLTGVKVERGDYVEPQLAERMDQPKLVGDIVSHWHQLANRRQTVVFATGVAHSLHLRDEFRQSGVWAEHIDGTTPTEERDRILAQLAAGKIELVVNAMVLTEGWDCPEVACLILARPTRSLGLYRQMVGRVLRPSSGKTDALILDHAGAVFEHGLPDDVIQWTLSADKKACNATRSSSGRRPGPPALTACPECTAVRFEGRPCTACGWRATKKGASVEVAEGELGHVDRSRSVSAACYSPAERMRFFSGLLWIGRERGYKLGWASYKFKEKFGTWPPASLVEPMLPDEATRAWVRSRQIAYAKATHKRRSA